MSTVPAPTTFTTHARITAAGSFVVGLALWTLTPLLIATIAVIAAAIAIATWASIHDLRDRRLPNRITIPLITGTMAQLLALFAVSGIRDHDISQPLAAAGGGLILGGVYLAMGLFGWVGFGDVKLALGLGLAVGTIVGLGSLYIAPIAIMITGVQRIATTTSSGRLHNGKHAHGPALTIAAVVVTVIAIIIFIIPTII